MVFLQGFDVSIDSFPNVGDCSLFGLSLADATRETGAFRHIKTVLPGIDNRLSHVRLLAGQWEALSKFLMFN